MLSVVPDAASEERAYRKLVTDNRVDGVFLTDLQRQDPRVQLLEQLGLPAVLIGRLDQAVDLPSVNLDDTAGVAGAASTFSISDTGASPTCRATPVPARPTAASERSRGPCGPPGSTAGA